MRRREFDRPCLRCREEGVETLAFCYLAAPQRGPRIRVWICPWHNTEVDAERVDLEAIAA